MGSEGDKLPPLVVQKETPIQSSHHNRSASCDSYFEASLAELAGMRLRLTSQEREMDIFSEDDTTRQVNYIVILIDFSIKNIIIILKYEH